MEGMVGARERQRKRKEEGQDGGNASTSMSIAHRETPPKRSMSEFVYQETNFYVFEDGVSSLLHPELTV